MPKISERNAALEAADRIEALEAKAISENNGELDDFARWFATLDTTHQAACLNHISRMRMAWNAASIRQDHGAMTITDEMVEKGSEAARRYAKYYSIEHKNIPHAVRAAIEEAISVMKSNGINNKEHQL